MITLTLPLRINSPANNSQGVTRGAMIGRSKTRQKHKGAMALLRPQVLRIEPVVFVTLTRIAPRELDSDNWAYAAKGLRDGVASVLGIDDGSKLIRWIYEQEHGKDYAVRVTVRLAVGREGA